MCVFCMYVRRALLFALGWTTCLCFLSLRVNTNTRDEEHRWGKATCLWTLEVLDSRWKPSRVRLYFHFYSSVFYVKTRSFQHHTHFPFIVNVINQLSADFRNLLKPFLSKPCVMLPSFVYLHFCCLFLLFLSLLD